MGYNRKLSRNSFSWNIQNEIFYYSLQRVRGRAYHYGSPDDNVIFSKNSRNFASEMIGQEIEPFISRSRRGDVSTGNLDDW